MDIIHTQTVNDGQFTMLENQEIVGYVKYEWSKNGNIKATGTFVDENQRGKKLGEKLFNTLIDFAKESHLKIFPICPYIIKMFERNPDLNEFIDKDYFN